jgi:hypothetical protein
MSSIKINVDKETKKVDVETEGFESAQELGMFLAYLQATNLTTFCQESMAKKKDTIIKPVKKNVVSLKK